MVINFEQNFEIKKLTSFKIGGSIARAYFPESEDDFVAVLKQEPDAVVLGNISNVLISDSGYPGAVILTSKMNRICIEGRRVSAMLARRPSVRQGRRSRFGYLPHSLSL